MQLLNEIYIDEMCHIMDNLHKYVPSLAYEKKVKLPSGHEITVNDAILCEILLGGDQLTVARARSSIAVRANHETMEEKLRGLVPVIEDWHSRMTFLKVF